MCCLNFEQFLLIFLICVPNCDLFIELQVVLDLIYWV
jgi:hypothetical protein